MFLGWVSLAGVSERASQLGRLVCQHVLLHLAHHKQSVQHLLHVEPGQNCENQQDIGDKKVQHNIMVDFEEPVQQLCRIPDWTIRDTTSLRLKIEHVVPVLRRLRTLAEVELVQLDRTSEGVLVVLVLLVHLPVLRLLALGRRWVVPMRHQ